MGWKTSTFGGGQDYSSPELARCLTTKTRIDAETETLIPTIGGVFVGADQNTIAFSCKDYGNDAAVEVAPTMRAMSHTGSHANAGGQLAVTYAIQAGALRTNPNSGPDGAGVQAEHAYTLEARAEVQAICVTGEVTHTLKDASEDGTGRGQPIVTAAKEKYARPQEANAITALRVLQQEAGAEAFAEWMSGVLDSFQSAKVLRQEVHGGGFRYEADEGGCGLDDGTLSRQESAPARALREMREAGRHRRTPQGRGLQEQLARELNQALSVLPYEGTPPAWLLHGMRGAGKGAGVLQSALPAVQIWPLAVRRLTPVECERLMGFPDDYTLIPVRGKPAADGPRYKALGNSWAAPNVRWIGHRIDAQLRRANMAMEAA